MKKTPKPKIQPSPTYRPEHHTSLYINTNALIDGPTPGARDNRVWIVSIDKSQILEWRREQFLRGVVLKRISKAAVRALPAGWKPVVIEHLGTARHPEKFKV